MIEAAVELSPVSVSLKFCTYCGIVVRGCDRAGRFQIARGVMKLYRGYAKFSDVLNFLHKYSLKLE